MKTQKNMKIKIISKKRILERNIVSKSFKSEAAESSRDAEVSKRQL